MSSQVLYLVVYASVLVFVVAVAWRFFRIYSLPEHLRWELYPVPHEKPERAKYGGSRLEELDHWTKPEEKNFLGQVMAMIPEMIFMEALFKHNRKMWYRSFPFHFGLYTLAGFLALLILGAGLELFFSVPIAPAASLGGLIYRLTQLAAALGLSLATIGALGLFIARLTDDELKDFTSFSHLFNLGWFIIAFGLAWVCFLFVDPGFTATRSFIQSLITFDLSRPLGGAAFPGWKRSLLSLEILFAVLLLAYIPLTHMSHFFIKWFTWDKIRWDDEPNLPGSELEKKIMEYLHYPVSWSAPHIAGGGKKTWLDVATEDMPEAEK